ncbi:MAG: hypothetical protein IPK05_13770 [Comamonadaceae bacterium]|nr:hypothetical protein [Comamonadaceae bacterium]
MTEIEDGLAVLDGNHPLAGVTLVFFCTVSEVRAATAEELGAWPRGGEWRASAYNEPTQVVPPGAALHAAVRSSTRPRSF